MTDGEPRHLDYSEVDQAPDPQTLVDHMDRLRRMDPIQEVKRKNFDFLDLRPGHHVLDVGCGPGDDARELARRVGANGRAVGVDKSETMLAEAQRRSNGLGLPVEFRAMDASQLEFADDRFDAVRADRVLQHVDDPASVLAEFVRVTKPGGVIAVSDTDWGMMGMDMSNRELTRRLLSFAFDSAVRNPWIGRQLPRLFREAGLLNIRVEPHALMPANARPLDAIPQMLQRAQEHGVVSADEARAWKRELDERDAAGTTSTTIVMFTAAGRKP